MIEIYFNILDKLEQYLVSHLGFIKVGCDFEKTLSPAEYQISPELIERIFKQKPLNRCAALAAIEEILVENYISTAIMESALENIDWAPEEREFFTCGDNPNEAEEQRAYEGWSEIESWAASNTIKVNRKELKEYIKNIKTK